MNNYYEDDEQNSYGRGVPDEDYYQQRAPRRPADDMNTGRMNNDVMQQGYSSQGYPSQGYASQGYPEQARMPQQRPSQGQQRPQQRPSQGQQAGAAYATQQRRPAAGGQTAAARHDKRNSQKKQLTYIIILAVEALVLVAIIVIFAIFYKKLDNKDYNSASASSSEQQSGGNSGSVNVDNDKFALTCYQVQLVRDVDDSPVALIFFTFTNKTAEPLAMSEVFPPKVVQNGQECETFAVLENAPEELYNRDTQISDGASLECCYAVKIFDTASTLTLTIHDNYETFTDIGSVDIPLP